MEKSEEVRDTVEEGFDTVTVDDGLAGGAGCGASEGTRAGAVPSVVSVLISGAAETSRARGAGPAVVRTEGGLVVARDVGPLEGGLLGPAVACGLRNSLSAHTQIDLMREHTEQRVPVSS
jgi:hypothetical protein